MTCTFMSWLLKSFDLLSYRSKFEKICTLSLLLMYPWDSFRSCSAGGGEGRTMNSLWNWFAWGAGSRRKLDILLPEACSKPCYTFKMELFTKIISGFQQWTIFSKRSILDIWQGSEYTSACPVWLLTVSYLVYLFPEKSEISHVVR